MPYELFRVGSGGTLTRYRSVVRKKTLAGALHGASTPTVGIDINKLTVAGVSPHLIDDDLVGLGFHEVCARFDPAYRPVVTEARPVDVHLADAPLRLAGTAEMLGVLLMFGSALALVVGLFVVADASLLRAEKTLAFLAVAAGAVVLVALGTLLRSAAILLRRAHEDP